MVKEAKTDFMESAMEVMNTAVKFKKVMHKRGIRRARTKCPRCGGWLYGQLHGKKDHIHMSCEGECGMRMCE